MVPYWVFWGHGCIRMLYGYVTHDVFPLMVTYAVGDVLSIGFLAVYFKYSTERTKVLKLSLVTLVICVVVTLYAIFGRYVQPEGQAADIVGFIAIASSVILYSSPLTAIKRVLREKNAESLPFPMIVIGIVNNTLWIIYGFLIMDVLLVVPTCINVVIGTVQFVLCIVYSPSRRALPVVATKPTASPTCGVELSTITLETPAYAAIEVDR